MICIAPTKPLIHPVASKKEIRDVQKFRYQILVEELGFDTLPGIDHRRRLLGDRLDDQLPLFAAYAGGRLVGTIRWGLVSWMTQPPLAVRRALAAGYGEGYHRAQIGICDRLAVAADHRGVWLNLELSTAACRSLVQNGCSACFCWARPRLCRLYQRLGFRDLGIVADGEADQVRRVMRLETSDQEHLKKIGSPFLEIFGIASNSDTCMRQ
ncbi:MAG: GNAT family N-acetyltransferase [Pirellulales bacterium]|jgi:ribosomal protein S18 acetylase RimI-like enzyme|nr:GNAT family N-acetyltransferase [Pirellulales bacterium]HJN67350.1 GNAT family N-acetyltransferase [Pirellulales bacterium]